jgi:phosphoserine phosphatase SerB
MSKEVSRAIISKAQRQHPEEFSEEDIHSLETINSEMNKTLREKLCGFHKMIVFDMDDTILKGRTIDACAKEFGFTGKLEDLRESEKDSIILTKRIGMLLKGRTMDDLLNVASKIEMIPDIKQVVKSLKERGYIVGIISNSYTLITNYVRQQIDADFAYANQLEFFEGKATGEVNLPFYFFGSPESICGHSYCKTNALQHACEKYNVQLKNCMAVGDSRDDRCMVGHAGKGVSFCTKDELLASIAHKNIREDSFQSLLTLA